MQTLATMRHYARAAALVSVGCVTLTGATQAADWRARSGMTSDEYVSNFGEMTKQGYRLMDVCGYNVGGQDRFAALWEKTSGPGWRARHGMTSDQYAQAVGELSKEGYRLVQVNGYGDGQEVRFIARWEKRDGAWRARHNLTSQEYQDVFNHMVADGFQPAYVDAYEVNGETRFAAIFEAKQSAARRARHGMTASEYQQAFDQQLKDDYRLIQVCGYSVGGDERFAAIWEQGQGPVWQARSGLSASDYQRVFDELNGQGLRPVCVSAYEIGGQPRFAAIWEKRP